MPRLLVEIDGELRRELKARLAREGITLKTWVTRSARAYVDARSMERPVSRIVASPASTREAAPARRAPPPPDDFLD